MEPVEVDKAQIPAELVEAMKKSGFNPEVLALTIMQERHQIKLNVPPPDIIAQYQKFYPNAAETFFRWADEEMQHRRKLDTKMVTGQVLDGHLGLLFGLVVVLAACAVAGLAIMRDHPKTAGLIICTSLVALASTFIHGRKIFRRSSSKPESKEGGNTAQSRPSKKTN